MSQDTVLKYMIDNDLLDHKKYMVSHHQLDTPNRIDVKTDEVIYIDKITINSLPSHGWLEFHSATESRIVQTKNYEQITRHKGNIYFSSSNVGSYTVSYIRLKVISNK